MTWTPPAGFWSRETFDSSSGATFSGSQGITGGYVTLLPTVTSITGYSTNWVTVANWDFDNGLETLSNIEAQFTFRTGAVDTSQTIPITGSNQILFSAGAWQAETFNPTLVTGFGYSGQEAQALELSGYLIDNSVFDSPFTIEMDLASTRSSDYSGIYGHGIYIDNNTNWDYLEVTDTKIQSLNTTGFGLPLSLSEPKRIRIAIDNNDVYLSSDDGSSVVGLGLLSNDVAETSENTSKITIGAPPISGNYYDLYTANVSGIAGQSLWDGIRIVTGEIALELPSGAQNQFYATTTQVLYSASFDPKIALDRYVSAVIEFKDYGGGTTTVEAQYYDTDWTDSNLSISLAGKASPQSLDLSTLPVVAASTPIRFKISQASSDGTALPPAVGEITLFGAKGSTLLDIVPSWKPKDYVSTVSAGVYTDKFFTTRPQDELWDIFYYKTAASPGTTGIAITASGQTGEFSGQIQNSGPYQYSTRNYFPVTSTAISGSDAFLYFGQTATTNIYPFTLLNATYQDPNGQAGYVTGRTLGELAEGLYIPAGNTGQVIVRYEKHPVFRPGRYAEDYLLALASNSSTLELDYTQKVTIEPTISGTFTDGLGIEAKVPSGIASSDIIFNADLQIKEGDYLDIYVSGDTTRTFTRVAGDDFRNFRQISFPATVTSTGTVSLGFTAPTGLAIENTQFLVDNILCYGYIADYINLTGVETIIHTSGAASTGIGYSTLAPKRANTIFSADFYLEKYPDSQSVLFEKKRDSDSKGLSIVIDNQGYLVATYDMVAQSRVTGVVDTTLETEEDIGTFIMTGGTPLSLGTWSTVSFVHQCEPYSGRDRSDYSGNPTVLNAVKYNRSFLLIDDLVVSSQDNMTGWTKHDAADTYVAPYISYIADQTGNLVAFSGAFTEFDNVKYSRPILADAEVDGAIKRAKETSPYFLPDKFYKIDYDNVTHESMYTFYGPGAISWDHGLFKNHLLLYSGVTKVENDNPYSTGWGCTKIEDGYAVAPYHSTFAWLYNTLTGLGLNNPGDPQFSGYFDRNVELAGWIKPETTGEFFSVCNSQSNITGSRAYLALDSSYNIEFGYLTTGGDAESTTISTVSIASGEWNWFHGLLQLATGNMYATVEPISGTGVISANLTGVLENYAPPACLVFGREATVSLADWRVGIPSGTGFTTWTGDASGEKSGRFTTLINDDVIMTGVSITDFSQLQWSAPKVSGAGNHMIWASSFYAHQLYPMYEGGHLLFDDQLFKEAESYNIAYDTSIIDRAYGGTKSPISIVYRVPAGGVNLAKFSSPSFSVRSSINTLDLSDDNPYNISAFRGGTYTLNDLQSSVTSTVSQTGFRGINSGEYTGMGDVIFSGAVYTRDLNVTSVSASDISIDYPTECFYYYLLGRGERGVYIPDAYGHTTIGNLSGSSTGEDVNNYLSNLDKVKQNIFIKTSKGSSVDLYEFPYDVITSPFTPGDLETAIQSGLDISINGLNLQSGDYTGVLPDGVFSTLLVMPQSNLDNAKSLWAHYPSYNYSTQQIEQSTREVINARPIMRETLEWQAKVAGTYELSSSRSGALDITIYGVTSGFTGQF